MVIHFLEMFADDVQAGIGHQVMDIGHAPGAGIVDGDHGEARAPVADRRESIVEGGAWQGRHLGIDRVASHV
jgi:hypothetical protein